MPTISQQCAAESLRPILRKSVSGLRRAFGMQRNTAKKLESLRPQLKILTEVVEPVTRADARAGAYRSRAYRELDRILKSFSINEMEGVLAHTIGDSSAAAFYPSEKAAAGAAKFTSWAIKQLGEIGMSEAQALTFLKRDFVALRQHKGDLARLDPNNIYPTTFQALKQELADGFLNANSTNAFVFGRELAGAVSRAKYLRPEIDRAYKLISSDWERFRGKGIPGDDIRVAQDYAREFLNARVSRHDEVVTQTASLLRGLVDQLGEAWHVPGAAKKLSGSKLLDDETLIRMADNAASWFGGYAMGFNPAMVLRDVVGGTLLPAIKVGPRAAFQGIREVWGRGAQAEALRRRLASNLNLPEELGAPLSFEGAEREGAFLLSKAGRALDRTRELGLLPRRWSDKMSRIAAARQGEVAIETNAPKLLSGKMSWEDFLYDTGLKGSSLVEQEKIRQLLITREVPSITEAAKEYGIMVAADSNFIYSPANAPAAFRGTVGRLFGQFGIWPVSFAEYMMENTIGARDAKWATRFATRFAGLQMALVGLSATTGVDTSTWMFSNPLTFQGGPWYQAFRDVTTLGTSTNEFERREASSNVRRMFGNSTTGFMGGILNPFGGATTNLFQAVNEDNPVDALLLGLGFNLVDAQQLATRRQRR